MRYCGTAIKSSIIINERRQFRNIRCYAAAVGFANVRLLSYELFLINVHTNRAKSHDDIDMLLCNYRAMASWIMIDLTTGYR